MSPVRRRSSAAQPWERGERWPIKTVDRPRHRNGNEASEVTPGVTSHTASAQADSQKQSVGPAEGTGPVMPNEPFCTCCIRLNTPESSGSIGAKMHTVICHAFTSVRDAPCRQPDGPR